VIDQMPFCRETAGADLHQLALGEQVQAIVRRTDPESSISIFENRAHADLCGSIETHRIQSLIAPTPEAMVQGANPERPRGLSPALRCWRR
jgi:hypothetical protein